MSYEAYIIYSKCCLPSLFQPNPDINLPIGIWGLLQNHLRPQLPLAICCALGFGAKHVVFDIRPLCSSFGLTIFYSLLILVLCQDALGCMDYYVGSQPLV